MSLPSRALGFLVLTSFLVPARSPAAKVFVYCSEGSPRSLSPQIAADGTSFNATKHLYDKLVDFAYGETKVVPALAESWDISKDGLQYTFKLRRDVKFHTTPWFTPTRTLDADDVLFSFNRQRLKDHPFHDVGGGSYEYFTSMEMDTLIKDIVKVDDHTVRFVLTHAEAPFLADLAMDFASILSAEYGASLAKKGAKEKIDIDPVGTGPFVFVRYDKDQQIRYKANPDYYRGRPAIESLVFAITTDPSVRFQKLKAGECHFAAEPAPADLPAMRNHPSLTVMSKPGLNVGYLAMNVTRKPFDNPLVRQAMNLALNRKSYLEAIYLGNAVVAKNPIPPTVWSYAEKTADYGYDPEKAKALLKKAGFPNGFSTELWTLPVSRPYNPNGKKMGELMQADLAKVGITAKLVTYDWPTYLEKTKNGEHALAQMGWTGDNGDPDNFLNNLLGCGAVKGGSNLARWCFKPFDDLVQKAKIVSQRDKRTKLYEEAQAIFKKEAPWVTIAHAVTQRAMVKGVQGYRIDPFGSDYFYPVDLKDPKTVP